ncbi:MAG: signal transduction protein [Candidatus Accumulibacter sp.]|nr:signal transduction protein [Accumulibacter sp.]MBA4094317.1 signal transduction protein [Accumulibacter sp.]
MSEATHRAAEALRRALDETTIGELSFPTSVDASRRVMKAVENPDLGLDALAKIVVAEPLLSAKVIRLANSVALNPLGNTVRDVKQAVMRVGMDPIKSLAMSLVLDQLRQSHRHSRCRQLSNRLWERSIHIAALSYVLARKLTRLDADEAMFAGIVHDLGRFYLLSRAAEYPELLDDTQTLAELINDLGDRAGARVLGELDLPESVVHAVLASRRYGGSMPPATLGDLLFVAGALSPRTDPFDELDARVVIPENRAVALGLDQSTVVDAITASGDEIYSIVVALES